MHAEVDFAMDQDLSLMQQKFKVDFYKNRILEKYSKKDPNVVTLKQLILFGRQCHNLDKLLVSANYVRQELPIRLAHRISMFQQLPFVVGTNPYIERVYNEYWEAFDVFRQVDTINSLEDNNKYCGLIQQMLNRHKPIVPYLVQGIHESQNMLDGKHLNKFMNETLQSRLSRRVLAEQHIALTKAFSSTPNKNLIGIVNNSCDAYSIIKNCVTYCDSMFMDTFDRLPPKVVIDGVLNATFVFIPQHIETVLIELIKNSMRFTYNHCKNLKELPPIHVTVGQGDGRIMFRVSDKGK